MHRAIVTLLYFYIVTLAPAGQIYAQFTVNKNRHFNCRISILHLHLPIIQKIRTCSHSSNILAFCFS